MPDEPPDKDAQLRDARDRFATLPEVKKIGADLKEKGVEVTRDGVADIAPGKKPDADGTQYKGRELAKESPPEIPPPGKGKSR